MIEPIQYKAASTRWEREQAYRLLYESYLRLGWMAPSSAGIRFNGHFADPDTLTFIAVSEGVVIATMSIFADSKQGLPMEDGCRGALDALRRQGRKIVKIGGLAHQRGNPRRGLQVFLILARMCSAYALRQGVTDFLIDCSRYHAVFYSMVMGFEQLSPERRVSCLRGALLSCYRFRREEVSRQKYRWFFNGQPLPEIPERPPEFSIEDRTYFHSLIAQDQMTNRTRTQRTLVPVHPSLQYAA